LTGLIHAPAKEAAKLVVAGKANGDDTTWTAAYKAVLRDVEKAREYKDSNEKMFERTETGEGNREKELMDQILAAIAKKKTP
jgi:hypothetical protein